MKTLPVLLALACLLSCKKNSDNPKPAEPTQQPLAVESPTTIVVSTTSLSGDSLYGVSVSLYKGKNDFDSKKVYKTATAASNKANVVFSGLESDVYYFTATSMCYGTGDSVFFTNSKIEPNKTTRGVVRLQERVPVKLTSTSTNRYAVYIDERFLFDLNGGETKTLYTTSGRHNVRVIQREGYILLPTDKTYTIDAKCYLTGEDKISFPN